VRLALLAATLLATTPAALAGCGGASPPADTRPARLPASYIPLTVGPGPRYEPRPGRLSAGQTPAGLGCATRLGLRFGAHVELFANRHVVLIPPGIGVVDATQAGAAVEAGRCFYPLVTLAPTGVVEVSPRFGPPLTLGGFFALWGQPLSSTRLAGFAGHAVHAFVDGRSVPGDPAEIPLRRHAEIVLETSGYVVPHASYRFVDGL
jgi:hypothetical protein